MCFSRWKFAWGYNPRLCCLQIVWIRMGVRFSNQKFVWGYNSGCAVCRLFGYVWGCVSPNRNSFGVTILAVQSVDCLDTYGGVSLFVWGYSPRLCSLQIFGYILGCVSQNRSSGVQSRLYRLQAPQARSQCKRKDAQEPFNFCRSTFLFFLVIDF